MTGATRLAFISAAAAACLFTPVEGSASEVHWVPPPAGPVYDLSNIQDAIDAAHDGDIIQFHEGTYLLDGTEPEGDVQIATPGGTFSFRDSVLSFFMTDPDGAFERTWIDTRGLQLSFRGTTDAAGDPATIITQPSRTKDAYFLVHSERVSFEDVAFKNAVSGIVAFAPVDMRNVDFSRVFYPMSAYVDSRFAHPGWSPSKPLHPHSFDLPTVPVVWDDVRYLHCGQSHIFMSGWRIKNSYFQTEQYKPWGEGYFYANIFTGAMGGGWNRIGSVYGGDAFVEIPEDVLAVSVFRDFIVTDSVFIGGDTSAGIDVTLYPARQVPTQGGHIVIRDNLFMDTEGDGFSTWTGMLPSWATYPGQPIVGVEVIGNVFDNVWWPLFYYAPIYDPPVTDLVERDNVFIP